MHLYLSRLFQCALLAAVATAAGACEEFATPAELAGPQILAVQTKPPAVRPGERVALEILVAGPDGEIEAPDVSWAVEPAAVGTAPIGTIEIEEDGSAYYRAPAMVAEEPTFSAVRATVQVDDLELDAIKTLGVTILPFENPSVSLLRADEQDLLAADAALRLSPGQTVELEVDIAPAIINITTFSWYATVGEIEEYRSNPTELIAPEEAAEGVLFVVVRDGLGGSTWAQVPIIVSGAASGAAAASAARGAAGP
ncbi:MAG: hypothetical protein Tsb0020_21260 [Haliangiales bacterium]